MKPTFHFRSTIGSTVWCRKFETSQPNLGIQSGEKSLQRIYLLLTDSSPTIPIDVYFFFCMYSNVFNGRAVSANKKSLVCFHPKHLQGALDKVYPNKTKCTQLIKIE